MSDRISAKITRFGYIIEKRSMGEEELKKLKENLTVVPFKPFSYNSFKKDDSYSVYVENGKYLSIPKYYGINEYGNPKINRLETYEYPIQDISYIGLLRPNQQIIVDKIIKNFDTDRGGLLIAGCGSGKTNMAIYVACHYKVKTLFVVHKTFLMEQAIDRIKSTTNVKQVGIIKQSKVETDYPFVVAMVHSLCKREYDDKIFKDFGLIIFDEAHHMAARNFSRVLIKMTSKYMLGISAERERKDLLFKVINWYIGPIIHEEQQRPNNMVIVKKFFYKTSNLKRVTPEINKYTQKEDWSKMVSNLMHIKKRTRFIINLIQILHEKGANVLFLTERTQHAHLIKNLLEEEPFTVGQVGMYMGGMNKDDLKISSTKQIILGTYQMAEEGLDIQNLNALIMGTPKTKINQSIGRILRKDVYEEHPIVIDIVDADNKCFKNQSYSRMKYYLQQNYRVQTFNVSDYELDKHVNWDDVEDIKDFINEIPAIVQRKPVANEIYSFDSDSE